MAQVQTTGQGVVLLPKSDLLIPDNIAAQIFFSCANGNPLDAIHFKQQLDGLISWTKNSNFVENQKTLSVI